MWNKIQKIYIGSNLVRPKWKPDSNTLAYYPLKTDFNDASWNWNNLTNSNVTLTTQWGVACAYFNGSNAAAVCSVDLSISSATFNVWINKSRNNGNERFITVTKTSPDSELWLITTKTNVGNVNWVAYIGGDIASGYNNTGIANWTWMHVVYTIWESWNSLYVNGSQVTMTYHRGNASAWLSYARAFSSIMLWKHQANIAYYQWYLSNAIIENRVWTAQEIADYYNQTKSNYWF